MLMWFHQGHPLKAVGVVNVDGFLKAIDLTSMALLYVCNIDIWAA